MVLEGFDGAVHPVLGLHHVLDPGILVDGLEQRRLCDALDPDDALGRRARELVVVAVVERERADAGQQVVEQYALDAGAGQAFRDARLVGMGFEVGFEGLPRGRAAVESRQLVERLDRGERGPGVGQSFPRRLRERGCEGR